MQLSTTKRPEITDSVSHYRGRFAPSPSGLLHFGSLIAALASFLDAKAFINNDGSQGKWLLRIEDIDPPREQAGASNKILSTLEAFGLHWDESVLYQSKQAAHYNELLDSLHSQKLSYHCQCTRAEIKAIGGIYQGHCKTLNYNYPDASQASQQSSAIRLINHHRLHQFSDIFQGAVSCNQSLANEDFIIHRKDGLFAYQLAVVADDIAQNINHVIRGCDLLEPTARQLTFFKTLNNTAPQYGHVPLAVTAQGYKLSKQNKALAIDDNNPQPALCSALAFLGQNPPTALTGEPVANIIAWAIKNWHRSHVPNKTEISLP
jgi:glutamyl-Q tRNA(Asp) synthetase